MVDTKNMKLQDKNLLQEVKKGCKLKHVNEKDIKTPKVEGLGHVKDTSRARKWSAVSSTIHP